MHKPIITILVPTYNRPDKFLYLLKLIKFNSGAFNVKLIVVNDGSTLDYSEPESYLKEFFNNYHYTKLKNNQWKQGFWKVVSMLFNKVKDIDTDYIFQLSDDLILKDNYFQNAIDIFEQHDCVCLNTLLLNEMTTQPAWTGISKPKETKNTYIANWVDNCFVATKEMLSDLNYEIAPIFSNNISSGVGKQVTQRLLKLGHKIHLIKERLIAHGDHESVMHPEHRKKRPLTA